MKPSPDSSPSEVVGWLKWAAQAHPTPELEPQWALLMAQRDAVQAAWLKFREYIDEAERALGPPTDRPAAAPENFERYFAQYDDAVVWRSQDRETFLLLKLTPFEAYIYSGLRVL